MSPVVKFGSYAAALTLVFVAAWSLGTTLNGLAGLDGPPLAAPEAARYGGAHRVLLGPDVETGLGRADDRDVTRLLAPASDRRAFAAFVGRYAAFLAGGRDPGDAFRAAVADVGWELARHG